MVSYMERCFRVFMGDTSVIGDTWTSLELPDMWCCLCAARPTRASVSSARPSLLSCIYVHDVFLAWALILVASFLYQIHTFTLPARLRVACVAVPFLCGRVGCGCPTCVRCGCATSGPVWETQTQVVGSGRARVIKLRFGQDNSDHVTSTIPYSQNDRFNQYFESKTSLHLMPIFTQHKPISTIYDFPVGHP